MSPNVTTASTAVESLPYGVAAPGYRLPAATHIGRVRLQVASVARSVDYYEQVIGFRVLAKGDDWAVLGAHGDERPLVELRELAGARPVSRRGRLGLYHFAILLPDRPSLGRLLAHLEEMGAYAGMSDHFVSEAIYLTDPDGLGIEVYVDRPRSGWTHHDRQLTMTTVPLDVQSVLAAGADEPWTGAPAGTVIGHVHLYVGDLRDAEAFYHRALGLDKVVWSYPGALFMSAGGYHHHLGTNTWAGDVPPAAADDARLLDWEVVVPGDVDAEGAAHSLEAAGYAVHRGDDGWRVADPWGTMLRLRADVDSRRPSDASLPSR